jgi:hypothetical protein
MKIQFHSHNNDVSNSFIVMDNPRGMKPLATEKHTCVKCFFKVVRNCSYYSLHINRPYKKLSFLFFKISCIIFRFEITSSEIAFFDHVTFY